MKNIAKLMIAPLIAASVLASGCVMIESSAISDRSGAGNVISASASDMGYVHLVAPQALTSTAATNLLAQCATGKVSGVTTELTMRDFILVQMYNVSATGFCQ
ncbi:MAG: hypothetical protein JWM69_272 [Candidatus Binatus sp.]|nr:hypothetical protein [Candidatus Binatus sp.]